MSINNSLKLCIGLFLSLFLMVACQKEQNLTPQVEESTKKILPQLDGVQLIDNHLVFESQDAYNSVTATLNKNTTEAKSIIQANFPEFVSLEDAYNNISESERERISETGDLTGYEDIVKLQRGTDGEISAEFNTGLNQLSILVNSKGIIQIGKEFRKIEYDNTYSLSKEQFNAFTREGKIGTFLKKEANNIVTLGETGMNDTNARASRTCDARTDGKKKRVRGKVQYASGEIIVMSKHQKRVSWVWWTNQAQNLSYSGSVTWNSNQNGAQSWSSSQSCTNCSKVQEAVFQSVNGESVSNIHFSISHSGTSGGHSGTCSTNL